MTQMEFTNQDVIKKKKKSGCDPTETEFEPVLVFYESYNNCHKFNG